MPDVSPQSRASNAGPLMDAETLLRLYKGLLIIRRAEERLVTLFADGEVPGFIHLSIGQEAVSVGVMSALGDIDTIASTHRGHGHGIAKGLPLDGFFAELLGRDSGLCKGRGGSMHVADMSIGMLGANGIVGAGLSIALGSALAHKTLGRDAVAVAFFGDAACAEGLLHECLNLAALWKLPLLFVCESNGWGEFLPTSKQIAFDLAALALAHAIPYRTVDGNDVAAVSTLSAEVVAGVRGGGGPAMIECRTHRIRGHYEGDAQKYRDAAEIADLADGDPIKVAARQLALHDVGELQLAAILVEVDGALEAALEAARGGGEARFDTARADVYTPKEAA